MGSFEGKDGWKGGGSLDSCEGGHWMVGKVVKLSEALLGIWEGGRV